MSFLAYIDLQRAVRPDAYQYILGRTWIQPKINTKGIISILYHLIKMKIDIMLISGMWQQWQRRTVAYSAAVTFTLSYYLTYLRQYRIIADILKREFVNRSQKLHYLNLHIKYISYAKKWFTNSYINIISYISHTLAMSNILFIITIYFSFG